MRLPLGTLFAFLFIAARATEIASDKTELAPQVFAPGIVSTDLDESSGSFSPDGKDSNPTVAADGTLYFASDRDGAAGYFHIYRARLTNGNYEQPEKLGPEINSGEAEINPYISPDQKVLIFASFTRKDTLAAGGNPYTRADLYISTNRDDRWTTARHLEHGINTTATEGNPSISPDGRWSYFTSERSPFDVPIKQRLTTAA